MTILVKEITPIVMPAAAGTQVIPGRLEYRFAPIQQRSIAITKLGSSPSCTVTLEGALFYDSLTNSPSDWTLIKEETGTTNLIGVINGPFVALRVTKTLQTDGTVRITGIL